MKAILVVSTTGLGDCLWGTPALRALKKSFPVAQIDLLVNPRWRSVFHNNPYISNSYNYCYHWYLQPFLGFRFVLKNYDAVLIFHSNRDFRRLLPWIKTSSVWAHQVFPWIPEEFRLMFSGPVHGIQRRLTLIEKIGALSDGPDMDIFLTETEGRETRAFLKNIGFSEDPFIYVNVGASLPHKRWHADRFIELSKNILTHTSLNIILGGGPEDESIIVSIKNHLDPRRTHQSCHRSIRANCALIGQARLLITADTGPLHIGLALKVPLIALFGPTLSQESGPYKANGQLCKVIQAHADHESRMNDPEENCFNSITVQMVWQKVQEFLQDK